MSGLEVRGLTRTHPDGSGRRAVITGLDLDIASGQSTALLGRSGCGKTTLLRALLLADRPGPHDTGTISLDGAPVRAGSARRLRAYRRAVQYVPQEAAASLDPRRTILEQVARPLRTLGIEGGARAHEERAGQLLDELDIPRSRWSSRPHEISGGQAQRVAIARALGPRPRYLLLDEPVSGLDPALRRQVLALLAALGAAADPSADSASSAGPASPAEPDDDPASAERGAVPAPALLVVSHDLAAVARICHRCLVMDQGRIVEDAPMGRILTSPAHPATRALRDAVPDLPA